MRIGKAVFHDIAWQHEAFLDDPRLAIDNAAAQDASSPARRLETTKHQNREVVLVDDGSEVPVTCQQPAVLLVRNEDPLGTSGARRHGAEIANRDVFVWLDAHLTFAPSWLDQMMVHVNSGSFLCSEVWDHEQSTCYCRGSDIIWSGERDYWSQCYPGFVPRHRTRFPGEARLKYQ